MRRVVAAPSEAWKNWALSFVQETAMSPFIITAILERPLDVDAMGLDDEVEEILDDAEDVVLVTDPGPIEREEVSVVRGPFDAVVVADKKGRGYSRVQDDELELLSA